MVAPSQGTSSDNPVIRHRAVRGARRFANLAALELAPPAERSSAAASPSQPLFALGGLAIPGGYAWQEILADFVAHHGNVARAESIPGHDGTPSGPHSVLGRNWQSVVQASISKFQGRLAISQTHGAGLSTGALLLLSLAATQPEMFSSLFLVGPPLELKARLNRFFIKLLALGGSMLRSRWTTNIRPRDFDNYAQRDSSLPFSLKQLRAPAYEHMNGEVFHGLDQARRQALGLLRTLDLPTLVAYGRFDGYVNVDRMCKLWSSSASTKSLVLIFEGSPHDILCGPELSMARDVSAAFHREFKTLFAPSPERAHALQRLGVDPEKQPRVIRLAQGGKQSFQEAISAEQGKGTPRFWDVIAHYGVPERP